MSEATLRRRLVSEQGSLTELIIDVRMNFALTLLQSTDYPVSQIALDVGYESQSKFAIRFRKRYGFSPMMVREKSKMI
jgi:AraC-like DNA-binding protein